jgi:hypothetical protein
MDTSKRGAELVLAELLAGLSKEADSLALTLRDRPDDFGLTRIAGFVDGLNRTMDSANEVAVSYMAAERIRGRK